MKATFISLRILNCGGYALRQNFGMKHQKKTLASTLFFQGWAFVILHTGTYLTTVQNSAARIVTDKRKQEHVSPLLKHDSTLYISKFTH